MARIIGLIGLVALVVIPLVDAQPAKPLQNEIQFLATSTDGQPFDAAVMISGVGMDQKRTLQNLSRSFPLGTNIGAVFQASEGSQVSVKIQVVKEGVRVPAWVSAVGEHVMGEVLANEPRVSAFK